MCFACCRKFQILPLPRIDEIHLNGPALLATVAVTIATTLLFGWIPSLSVSQLSLSSALRTRGGEGTGRRRSSLSLLVVTEIACSVVLTVSVGLLVHSFWRVIHVDPGFQASVAAPSLFTDELLHRKRSRLLERRAHRNGIIAGRAPRCLIGLAARPRRRHLQRSFSRTDRTIQLACLPVKVPGSVPIFSGRLRLH